MRCARTGCLLLLQLTFLCALPQLGLAGQEAQSDDNGPMRLFNRVIEFGAGESHVIPFSHPGRPTIYMEAGGYSYPMIFDSGALACIFINDGTYFDPGLRLLENSEELAALEGKSIGNDNADHLQYAELELARLGGIRVRNLPFRIFNTGHSSRDYAGAIAPVIFSDYIVEVDNAATEIRLNDPADWLPPEGCILLPLLTLPRGTFVPAAVSGEQCWLHLDTGFSGTLGLTERFLSDHPHAAIAEKGQPANFQGWRESVSCDPLVIPELILASSGDYLWTQTAIVHADIEGCAFPRTYDDVPEITVAGVIGSGLLASYNYAIDYRTGRMYLWQ